MSQARTNEEVESLRLRLSESEQRLQFALEAAELGLWDYDLPTGAVVLDERTATLLGHPQGAGASRTCTWEELVHPDDWPGVREELNEYVAGRRPRYQTEYRLRHASGAWMWVLAKGQVIARDGAGRPQRLCGAHLSITEPTRARAAIQELLEQHRRLQANVLGLVYQCASRPDGSYAFPYVNSAVRELFGLEPDDVMRDGTCLSNLIHPEDRARRDASIRESARTLQPWRQELRHMVNGEVRWHDCMARPQVQPDGTLLWDGIVVDITDRKRAEAALEQTHLLLGALLDQSPVPTVVASAPDLVVRYANGAALEFLGVLDEPSFVGLTLAEIRQRQTWRDLRADGTPIDLLDLPLARALRGVVTQGEEYSVIRKDGTQGWELVSGTPIYDRAGALVAGLIVFPDITERKRAEAERARLTAILEGTSDLVATATPTGQLTYLNAAGRRLLGWNDSEDVSAHCMREAHPAWAAELVTNEAIPAALAHGAWHGETAILSADGRELPVLQVIMAHRALNGELQYLSTVVRDITERQRSEAALRESEERYRIVAEETGQLVYDYDTRSGSIRWCGAVARITGYSDAEFQSVDVQAWAELVHPDDRARALCALDASVRDCTRYDIEYRLRRKDGAYVDIADHGIVLADAEGRAYRMLGTMSDISARKAAAEELQKLASVVRYSSELVDLATVDGRMVFLNDAGGRMLGMDPREVEKHSILEVIPENWRALVQNEVLPALRAGHTWEGELQYRNLQTGQLTDVHATTFMIADPATGQWKYLANVSLDITARKRAEETVAAAAHEWQTTFDAVNDVIWMLDREFRIVRCNAATAVYFGKDPARILGRHCWEVVHGTAGPIPECPVVRMARSKHRESMELRLGAGWYSIDVDPILDAAGVLTGAVHIVSDITERKRAEQAIRHYAQRLEKLRTIERATLANEPLERIVHEALQYLQSLVPGQRTSVLTFDLEAGLGTLLDVVSDAEALLAPGVPIPMSDFADSAGMAALAAGRPRLTPDTRAVPNLSPVERRLQDQGFRTLLCVPLHTGHEFIGALNVGSRTAHAFTPEHVDIATEVATTLSLLVQQVRLRRQRAAAEHALRASEAKYRTLFERSADGMLLIDGDRFVDCNDAAARILRYGSRAELMDRHPWEISPAFQPDGTSSQDLARTLIQRAANERSLRFEWDHATADGTIVPVEVVLTPVPFGERELLHVSWRDITARRRAEAEQERLAAQLRQAQKMEAIGQLAGGVAHDFNNILTAIFGHVELAIADLQARLPDARSTLDGMQEIQRSAQRASALTRQLLAFSRRQLMRPAVLDLNATLRDLEKMLQRLIAENIVLELTLAPNLPMVEVDPGQIEQVIVNLVVNARDAMREGGKLTLHTSVTVLDAAYTTTYPEARTGEHTVLTVSDTGCGMNQATLERIFEPFFTTKPQGEGTGLGLPTVYGIVKQAGGHIAVYSEPSQGTVFRVYLPSVHKPATALPHRRSEPAPPVGTETILLCEDDAAVRELAAHLLAEAGYRVLAAPDAGHALQTASQHLGPIDLLLTDVIMPGMNGRKLAGALRARRPDLKTLFMSGYTSNVIAHHGVLEKDVEFLEKPFSRRSLLQRVREVLDKPALTGEPR